MQTTSASPIASRRRPLLMAWRIQYDQCEYEDVPHAIDAGEKGRCKFQMHQIVPMVLALGHLANDKTGDGQCGTNQGGQHQEFEAIDDALVVQAPSHRHGRQCRTLDGDVTKYTPNHVAQEHKVHACRYAGQYDEGEL